MTRYVIVGAGAIGASVAAQLHLSGSEVVLVARGEHAKVIRTEGLRYLRPDGEQRVAVPVVEGSTEVALTPDDVLFVATKSQDTEAVLTEWAWLPVADGSLAAQTIPLVSLQNGIENERAALRRFARTSGAAVWMPSSYLRPGEIVSPGEPEVGVFWLGRYPGGLDPDAQQWAADLRAANFGIQLVADLPAWKAGKLLSNLVNGVVALYGMEGRGKELAEALQDEGRKVLEAAGQQPKALFADSEIDLSRYRTATVPGGEYVGGSTRQSLTRGAGSVETDFLNGEIVLLGRLHGIPTPLNAAVQGLLAQAARAGTPAGGGDPAVPDALLKASTR
jgi:2-dehydropantoate 2-reductase